MNINLYAQHRYLLFIFFALVYAPLAGAQLPNANPAWQPGHNPDHIRQSAGVLKAAGTGSRLLAIVNSTAIATGGYTQGDSEHYFYPSASTLLYNRSLYFDNVGTIIRQTKNDFTYDGNGYLTQITGQWWNATTSVYENSLRVLYTNNASGDHTNTDCRIGIIRHLHG